MRLDKPYTSYCTICKKDFDSPLRLSKHWGNRHTGKVVEHLTGEEYIVKNPNSTKLCSFCRALFLSSSAKARHVRSTHEGLKARVVKKRHAKTEKKPTATDEVVFKKPEPMPEPTNEKLSEKPLLDGKPEPTVDPSPESVFKKKKFNGKREPVVEVKCEPKIAEPIIPKPPCDYIVNPKLSVVHFSIYYDYENNAWASSLPNFISGYSTPK